MYRSIGRRGPTNPYPESPRAIARTAPIVIGECPSATAHHTVQSNLSVGRYRFLEGLRFRDSIASAVTKYHRISVAAEQHEHTE